MSESGHTGVAPNSAAGGQVFVCFSLSSLENRGLLFNGFLFSTSYVQKCSARYAKRERKGQGGQELGQPLKQLSMECGSETCSDRIREQRKLVNLSGPLHPYKKCS